MTFREFPTILLCTSALVIVQSQLAVALTAVEVNTIAREITVRIEAPNDNSGSGVIVHRQGTTYYVLTSKHVIDKEGSYVVIAPDGEQYAISRSQIIEYPNVDLAMLQFNSERSYRQADLGDSAQLIKGRTVYVAGWINSGRSVPQSFQFTEGEVTSREETREGYNIIYSNVTQEGMSGGPVLDELGLVVGIHGLAETDAIDGTRVGLNLGIPINAFLELDSPLYGRPVQGQQAGDLVAQGFDSLSKKDFEEAFQSFNLAVQLDPRACFKTEATT